MTDTEWDKFVAGLVFGAGPRGAREILDADPDLRERLTVLERSEHEAHRHHGYYPRTCPDCAARPLVPAAAGGVSRLWRAWP